MLERAQLLSPQEFDSIDAAAAVMAPEYLDSFQLDGCPLRLEYSASQRPGGFLAGGSGGGAGGGGGGFGRSAGVMDWICDRCSTTNFARCDIYHVPCRCSPPVVPDCWRKLSNASDFRLTFSSKMTTSQSAFYWHTGGWSATTAARRGRPTRAGWPPRWTRRPTS